MADDECKRALARLREPDPALIRAAWGSFPTFTEIDEASDDAIAEMISAILREALRLPAD